MQCSLSAAEIVDKENTGRQQDSCHPAVLTIIFLVNSLQILAARHAKQGIETGRVGGSMQSNFGVTCLDVLRLFDINWSVVDSYFIFFRNSTMKVRRYI